MYNNFIVVFFVSCEEFKKEHRIVFRNIRSENKSLADKKPVSLSLVPL